MQPAPLARTLAPLARLAVLKADDAEILSFTGAADIGAAAARVQAAGVRETLVTYASRGSTVFGPAGRLEIAALPPRRHVDPTGCGDTYLAAYLTRRLTSDDLRACAEFAAAAASVKLEQFGPFHGTPQLIADRLGLPEAGGVRPARPPSSDRPAPNRK